MRITRRMDFSASYRDAEGRTHGHNYVLEVTLSGPIDPATGMVIDLKHLKDVMELEIDRRFDHRSLSDDVPYFKDRPATPENFAQLIFELLDRALPPRLLERVALSPTRDLRVEVER
jgi:6-pyruvoyltetrahydropterin/6-carboxytetrahydropterin synthase